MEDGRCVDVPNGAMLARVGTGRTMFGRRAHPAVARLASGRASGAPVRSEVLRMALVRGLERLEHEYEAHAPRASRLWRDPAHRVHPSFPRADGAVSSIQALSCSSRACASYRLARATSTLTPARSSVSVSTRRSRPGRRGAECCRRGRRVPDFRRRVGPEPAHPGVAATRLPQRRQNNSTCVSDPAMAKPATAFRP